MSLIVFYPVPEMFPDPKARFIQITHTCHALARAGAQVYLIAGIRPGLSKREILEYYGLGEHENLTLIKLPMLRKDKGGLIRFSWHGVFHFALLIYLFWNAVLKRRSGAIFIRHLKLAAFISRYKKLLGLPVVFEVHEIFHLTADKGKNRASLQKLEAIVYSDSDELICISEALREFLLASGIKPVSTHVVRRGVDRDWFDEGESSPSRTILLYTGSLYPWKGVDTLISAMEYLKTEKLVIVGGGGRLPELKRLAIMKGLSGRIEFTGQVPHSSVRQYISRAKVAVLPNIPEGVSLFSSPNKLFEYMAGGAPVVASNIPPFREVLTDGRNALLFEPGNPECLAACVSKILREPSLGERLSRAAREDVEDYTHEAAAIKIISILEDALKKE